MDRLATEKIINKARTLFSVFFLISAISSYKTGAMPGVYLSLFIATGISTSLMILNFFFIRRKHIPLSLIYFTVTTEALTVFFVKFCFHYDSYNGFGMAIKESATFMIWFLFAVINGLRFNKRLNLYYGALWLGSYFTLIILGVAIGDMVFVTDNKLVFTPHALRGSTELAKLLFISGITYFLYLMGDFTTRNIDKIETARQESINNYSLAGNLLKAITSVTHDLVTSSNGLSTSTATIETIIQKNGQLITEANDKMNGFSLSIKKIHEKIAKQNTSLEQNTSVVNDLSSLIDDIHRVSTAQSDSAKKALEQAAINERNILKSKNAIGLMQANSRKIEDISETINDIADKTNLLSLNASIESARAGEYGRGFAVVADEISKLAGISIDSSKQIAAIIKETVKNSEEVALSVEDMSRSLNDIIAFVKDNYDFTKNLNRISQEEYSKMKNLLDSIKTMEVITGEVKNHFDEQDQMARSLTQSFDSMNGMSRSVVENLQDFINISKKLSLRSADMRDILASANIS